MANTNDRLDSRNAYLARLADNLNRLGEKGFRKLCEDLGENYDGLEGEGIVYKALNWVYKLEGYRLIPSLVDHGKADFPDYTWDDIVQVKQYPRGKYFVATTLKDLQIVEQFNILGDRFDFTKFPKQADYLIFDLDHPPEDWINYIGWQDHLLPGKPYYGTTIFVRLKLAGGQESSEVQLDGDTIFKILRKLHPEGYNFNLCDTKEDMLRTLLTLEENRQNQLNIEKMVDRQTLASFQVSEKREASQEKP